MSSEKVEMKSQESGKREGYQTVDVEMKLLEVGDLKYTLDVRQNGQSRFIRIGDSSSSGYSNCVFVPMCTAMEFHTKLMDVLKFVSSYTIANISEKKHPRDRMKFAYSAPYFTQGGRRYYFDVIDAQSTLTLRISYLAGGRRKTIRILTQAVPKLAGIIQHFHQTYPSLTPDDDYPLPTYRRMTNSIRPSSGQRGRGFNFGRGRRFSRGFRATSQQQFNGKQTQRGESTETKRPGALQVLSDPAPITITCGAKTYIFQIAEGTNTFLRINEAIKDNYKSSLHVPIELISEFQTALLDMNKKYSAIKKTTATEKE